MKTLSFILLFLSTSLAHAADCLPTPDGSNPCPTVLQRPPAYPLSEMARIGRDIFRDPALSGSGRLSCASCHDPAHHFGPSGNASVFLGGQTLKTPGHRAIPSLTYLERTPNFSIGPDNPESEASPPITPLPNTPHSAKNASQSPSQTLVPQGGLFWDGRANTLQQQASGPLFDPAEMASTPAIARNRVRHAPYTTALKRLAGQTGDTSPDLLLSEALFALARYQIESPEFHLYTSKFDRWLEGKARFTPQESAGYRLFNDPLKGNCAACHIDQTLPDHLPPLFTDHQYEALGVPRNRSLMGPPDNGHFDLGLCHAMPGGPKAASAYCGMFATPTLRNTADRHVFFHNGVFHNLTQVLNFYAERDTSPQRFYFSSGSQPDDLPALYQANLDRTDAPLNRHRNEKPALTPAERGDIITFLKTLTDASTVQALQSGQPSP